MLYVNQKLTNLRIGVLLKCKQITTLLF